MSKTIDFIQTNLIGLNKIIRPQGTTKQDPKNDKKGQFSSIKIEKSFVPQRKSTTHEALRPQLDKLKQFYKKKLQEQKKMKALLAEGKIDRQGIVTDQKPQKQQATPAQQKVIVDQSGQIRDQQGNILFVKQRNTDLLYNRKKEQEIQIKSLAQKQKIKLHQKISRSFMDRNLLVASSKKRTRRSLLGLQFLQKGSYQPAQYRSEVKAEVQDLNDVLKEQQPEMKIIKIRNRVNLQFNKDIPEVQWWDSALLNNQTYKSLLTCEDNTSPQQIFTNIPQLDIQKSIDWNLLRDQTYYQKVGASTQDDKVVLPTYLTKDQRKKLKRKRKQQKLQQKNDKIKLGLLQPDKPKLRVGNMAIVMKNQFIIDPSKVQAQAHKQTQQRIDKHQQSNSIRKLTKAQKKDKIIRKLKRDSAKQCRRAVFKVDRLIDPTQIFKVNMNAKQLALNGFVIKPSTQLSQFPTMVVIEGGHRAVKFYKNLMTNRIQWRQGGQANDCRLVWEGEIENSSAGKWKVHDVGDQVEAIRLLTEKKFDNFWEYMN